MNLTPKHHRNSQIHQLPVQKGHKVCLLCPCGPAITTTNGHLMVAHKPGRGFRGSWSVRVRNFGRKIPGVTT